MRAAAVTKMRMPKLGRTPQIVAFVLLLGLVGAMAIEPTRQLIQQRQRISGTAAELTRVQESNARLEAQIARLNSDDYIEQRARAQIGLVRPGETTYVVMPPSKGAQPNKKKKVAKAKPEPPAPPSFVEAVLHFVGL
jgi:cell division protein FtsB